MMMLSLPMEPTIFERSFLLTFDVILDAKQSQAVSANEMKWNVHRVPLIAIILFSINFISSQLLYRSP